MVIIINVEIKLIPKLKSQESAEVGLRLRGLKIKDRANARRVQVLD